MKKWSALKYLKIEDSVLEGRVLCNGRPVEFVDEVVHRNEVITYTLHYHEPEVIRKIFHRNFNYYDLEV